MVILKSNKSTVKRLILSCLLVIVSYCSYAQDRQAILNVLETQRLAWNKGDIAGYMEGYWKSDSLLFVSSTAPTHGWEATLAHYKKGYPDKTAMGTLTFTILKVDVLDATNAFVLGGWNLKREKDAPGGYFTLWFKKINGEWMIVVDHTS